MHFKEQSYNTITSTKPTERFKPITAQFSKLRIYVDLTNHARVARFLALGTDDFDWLVTGLKFKD